MNVNRPHVLGIDDGPFEKTQTKPVAVVGVMMEGADIVEAVAVTTFPVDGDGATRFLTEWIGGARFKPSLQGIVIGGITIGGLGVVDVNELHESLDVPVLNVTRSAPRNGPLLEALEAAGLPERRGIVTSSPSAVRIDDGLYATFAGVDREGAERLLRAVRGKASLPEPLRLAHLIARAIVDGESRGRA